MIITWRGTASLSLRTEKAHLEFDPYGHPLNGELPPLDEREIGEADGIFITHPHPDHFADIECFAQNTPVYVSKNGIDRLQKSGSNLSRSVAIRPGDTFAFGDLSLKVYQSRHCRYNIGIILSIIFSLKTYQKLGNVFRFYGEMRRFPISDDIYMFEIQAEGKRICIMGSAGLDEKTDYPIGADLLIFPYQGRSDMAAYSLPLIERLQPKRVLFDHIDDAFPPFTQTVDTDEIIALLQEKMPAVQAEACIVGRKYEI